MYKIFGSRPDLVYSTYVDLWVWPGIDLFMEPDPAGTDSTFSLSKPDPTRNLKRKQENPEPIPINTRFMHLYYKWVQPPIMMKPRKPRIWMILRSPGTWWFKVQIWRADAWGKDYPMGRNILGWSPVARRNLDFVLIIVLLPPTREKESRVRARLVSSSISKTWVEFVSSFSNLCLARLIKY